MNLIRPRKNVMLPLLGPVLRVKQGRFSTWQGDEVPITIVFYRLKYGVAA